MSGSWVTAAIEGASSEVAIRIGVSHVLMARQPGDGRGRAAAPTPVDLVLAGLAACTAATLSAYAAARHWSLEVVEVDLEITRLPSSANITRLLSLKGSLDLSQREALLAAAEQTPITLLLAPGIRIHTELA